MTVLSLQNQPEAATPTESERLYRAWRYVRAQWELADHDPANPEGLSEEERDAFCDKETEAFIAYMMHPADAPFDVSRKVRSFHQEEGWQLNAGPQIIKQIVADVHALALNRR